MFARVGTNYIYTFILHFFQRGLTQAGVDHQRAAPTDHQDSGVRVQQKVK